jgi:hypothetical protein
LKLPIGRLFRYTVRISYSPENILLIMGKSQ